MPSTPVFGAVLIGGNGSRMGRRKHLLVTAGQTWLRRAVDVLAPLVARVVVLGDGEMPRDLPGDVAHLPDAPGVEAPLGAVLAAMRWAPQASWLVAPDEGLHLTGKAVSRLLATRTPGRWAALAVPAGSGRGEPLLAFCDFRCRVALENMACEGVLNLSHIAEHPKAAVIMA